jgi:cell division protein FtsZ
MMTAVTEQFGRDSHVIMGAVIDEDMQGKVELVVLGTSDVGGRSGGVRRPATPARAAKVLAPAPTRADELPMSAAPAAAPVSAPAGAAPAAELPLAPAAAGAASRAQDEFTFGEIERRGHFDKTDRNLFEGQDLDVPTYLRKGIKLAL